MFVKCKDIILKNKGFLFLMLMIIIVKSSIIDWNYVPSGSMRPTLSDGDQIVVNKLAYDIKIPLINKSIYKIKNPERGDIIIFDSKIQGIRMVKRLIGLPGDHLVLKDNVLFINGVKSEYLDNYSNEQIETTFNEIDKFENRITQYKRENFCNISHPIRLVKNIKRLTQMDTDVKIPDNMYFAMGDNRDESLDSRFWGFVERNEIVGQTSFVLFSLNKMNYYIPRANRSFHSIK